MNGPVCGQWSAVNIRRKVTFSGERVDDSSWLPSGGEGGVSMQLCDPKTLLYSVVI